MEISVINWWRKNHQPSTHEGLRLLHPIERCMGTKIRMDKIFKITETLTESTVSRWNSTGTSSKDLYVAAQRISQTFAVQIR